MPKGLDYLINLGSGDLSGADKAKGKLSGLDDAIDKTGKNVNGLSSIFKKAGGLIAGYFAVDAIKTFSVESNAAYRGMLAADAQNRAAIQSTGGAAGKTLDDLKASADALEGTTMFDADDTAAAQSLLLTFTKIKGAVFDEAIPAIQDMSQRMAGDGPADLKGASIQVGKALNDPIRGITALSKVGVSFTDTQKKTIESMVKHNNVAGAQRLILSELNKEFGGSAVAARQAAGGAADMHWAVEDLKEGFGGLISDGLEPAYAAMTPFIRSMRTGIDWLRENKNTLVIVAEAVGMVGGAYLLYQGYILATQAPMAIMTAAQWALNTAMSANPVGIIVAGIGLLVGGLVLAYKHSETFRAGLDGIISVGKLLGDVFIGVGKTILGALTFDSSMFMDGVNQSIAVAKKIAGGGIQDAFNSSYNKSLSASAKATADEKSKTTMDALVPKGTKPLKVGITPGAGSESTSVATNKQVRNVQVTIGKLVESLTVSTTNLQGAGSADIKRMITEILTGAVHDSELALSSE